MGHREEIELTINDLVVLFANLKKVRRGQHK